MRVKLKSLKPFAPYYLLIGFLIYHFDCFFKENVNSNCQNRPYLFGFTRSILECTSFILDFEIDCVFSEFFSGFFTCRCRRNIYIIEIDLIYLVDVLKSIWNLIGILYSLNLINLVFKKQVARREMSPLKKRMRQKYLRLPIIFEDSNEDEHSLVSQETDELIDNHK